MTRDHYILNPDGTLKVVPLLEWAEWFENKENRRIAYDVLPDKVEVSTVFLGIDHNFSPSGPPLLFETMIFGGPNDQWQNRYATKDEAIAGHKAALALATENKPA